MIDDARGLELLEELVRKAELDAADLVEAGLVLGLELELEAAEVVLGDPQPAVAEQPVSHGLP